MFKKSEPSPHDELLNEAIESTFQDFKGFSPNEEGYSEAVDAIVKLTQLKEEKHSKSRISNDTIVAVAGNLAGILLILNFERAGVVASKALSFVTKLK